MRHFRTCSMVLCLLLLYGSQAAAQGTLQGLPASLTRDSVKIGSVSVDTLVISKASGNPTVDSLQTLAAVTRWFETLIDTLPATLNTGSDSVAFTLSYSSTAIDTVQDTLFVFYDGSKVDTVPLWGAGGVGADSLSVSALAFDSVPVSQTKQDSFKVYNAGTAALEVRLEMQLGSAAYVALPDSFSVAPGDSQTVVVSFTPAASGDELDTILVKTDAAAGVLGDDTLTVALSGTGIAPSISFLPASLDFGNVLLGTFVDSSFRIQNQGTADLIISGVSGHTVEFVDQASPGRPDTIPPGGQSGVWTVRFSPAAAGARNTTLQFTTNVPGQTTVPYSLTGFGVNPDIDVTPLSYDFGEIPIQTRDTLAISVANVGNSDLTISSVSLQLGLTEFTIVQSIPPNTLIPPAAQPQIILVEVAPTTPNLTLRDTVVIVSDDPDEGTVKVAMLGVTVEARIQLTATAVDFGSIFVGQSAQDSVLVINDGSDTLSFTSVLGNSADFSVTPTSGDVLAGESLLVRITYAPNAAGADTSTWRLTTNAPANPQVDVALTGAASSRLSAPLIVNFGNVRVGESRLGSIVLQNASTVSAEKIPINSITMSAGFELVDPLAFPDTLDAQEAETLTVRFSPLTAGAAAGTATIAFVEPTVGADTLAVALSGSGIAATRTIVRVINYPNPFVPEDGTTILIGLGEAATVSVTIYDLSGQLLDELIQGQSYGAGEHEITWDGRRYDGAYVAYGVYLCEVVALPSGGGEEDREYRKLACGSR